MVAGLQVVILSLLDDGHLVITDLVALILANYFRRLLCSISWAQVITGCVRGVECRGLQEPGLSHDLATDEK